MKKCGLRKAYASGGMVLSDNQKSMLDSLDKRMGWGSYDTGVGKTGFVALPDTPSVAQSMDAGQRAFDTELGRPSNSAQSMLDGIVGNSALSGRQKAQAAMGLNTEGSLDVSGIRGLSARQNMALSVDQFNADAAARKRAPLGLAFADGGKIDPDALMAEMQRKYGLGAPGAGPAQPQQPQRPQAPQPAPQPQPESERPRGILNLLRQRGQQIDKASGYKQGGKVGVDEDGFIKGPGGVDNVPARVDETGEEIRVGAGERIVNKQQNAALEKLAAQHGMELDEYLETATGKPVGPTVKKGLRAAETGMAVRPWYAGTDSRDERTGLELERLRRAQAVNDGSVNDPVKSALLHGVIGQPQQAPVAPAPAAVPKSQPPSAPVTASLPEAPHAKNDLRAAASGIDADVITAARSSGTQRAGFMAEKDATQYDIAPGYGGGVVTGAAGKGGLRKATLVTGASESDAARDKEFEAKGYGKDAYGNWMTPQRVADEQALAKIQRQRAYSDAFSPEITDPNARANGLRQVMMYEAQDQDQRKQGVERAKLAMEMAKFGQEERKIQNLQGNADREFQHKLGETQAKRLEDILKAQATVDGKLDGKKYAWLQQYAGNFKSDKKDPEGFITDLLNNLELDSLYAADNGWLLNQKAAMGADPVRGLRKENGLLWGENFVDPRTGRKASGTEIGKLSPGAYEAFKLRLAQNK